MGEEPRDHGREPTPPAPLTNEDELLHRQVNPAFIQNGRVGSSAFKPTSKDEGQLSVSRDSVSSAEQAFIKFTQERGLKSAGVWSVTVGECSELKLAAFPDPLLEPVSDPAHAFVDFRAQASKGAERLAKRLAAFARERGCQYQILSGQ